MFNGKIKHKFNSTVGYVISA